MNTITPYISRKILHVKMICALLVISIHMYNAGLHSVSSLYYEQWFEDWWSQGVARIAVPLFFFMSGYLVFSSRTVQLNAKDLAKRLPHKLLRLFVPFVSWNFIYFVWSVMLDIILSRPITNTPIYILQALFLYKCNAPFWYIFQLIFLVALTPLLFVLLKRRATAIAVCVVCLAGFFFIPGNQEIFLLPGLLFYTIGATAFLHFNKSVNHVNMRVSLVALLILIVLLVWRVSLTDMEKTITDLLPTLPYKLFDILTPFAFWLAIDLFKIGDRKVYSFETETFLIYAMHSMLLMGIGIIVNKALGSFAVQGRLIIYLIMPIVVACICIVVAKLLRKIPFLYKVLSGSGLTFTKKKRE